MGLCKMPDHRSRTSRPLVPARDRPQQPICGVPLAHARAARGHTRCVYGERVTCRIDGGPVSESMIELPHTTERKTVELCADELQKGVRCILSRGHTGDHEFHSPSAEGAITWKRRTS